MQLTSATVYARNDTRELKYAPDREGSPTIIIVGDACDVYVSNADEEPADTSEMFMSETLTEGVHIVDGRTKWIALVSAGTSVITECGVVAPAE